MTITLTYDTFKDIFRRNVSLVYVISDGSIATVAPLNANGDASTIYSFTDDPPINSETFANDFPAAVLVASVV